MYPPPARLCLMSIVLLIGLCLLAAPAALGQEAAGAPEATQGSPVIVSPEPIFNFGEMDNAGKVSHDFVIRNAGDAVLQIQKVRTSCGCTVAQPKKNTLQPGEETMVSATFNLKGRTGAQTKTITVSSNDPKNPSYQLTIKGTAIAAFVVEPAMLNFSNIDMGATAEKTVTVRTTKQDIKFNITKVESNTLKGLKATWKPLVEGSAYSVTITLPEDLKPGTLNHSVMVFTDNEDYKMVPLRLYAKVIGALDYSPDKISIQDIGDPNKVVTQYVRVSPGKVKEFKITGIDAPLDTIKYEVTPHPSMGGYMVKLLNLPRDSKLDGKFISIKTDAPEMPDIRLPIKTYARQPRYNGVQKPGAGVKEAPKSAPKAPAVKTAPAAQ